MTTELFNAMQSGFSDVLANTMSGFNIAIIFGLSVFGIFILWAFIKKLFNKLAGNKESKNDDDDDD
jgi:hypothetical protein